MLVRMMCIGLKNYAHYARYMRKTPNPASATGAFCAADRQPSHRRAGGVVGVALGFFLKEEKYRQPV
jgi:hypothetical protein